MILATQLLCRPSRAAPLTHCCAQSSTRKQGNQADAHAPCADALQVNDSYRGTLSSYCYVLMAIHYLQQRSPPILPSLQAMPATHFRQGSWMHSSLCALLKCCQHGSAFHRHLCLAVDLQWHIEGTFPAHTRQMSTGCPGHLGALLACQTSTFLAATPPTSSKNFCSAG